MTQTILPPPYYKHDCSEEYGCVFLGRYRNDELGLEDLYVHQRRFGVEMIHRYSDEPEKYGCLVWPHHAPVYKEIERRCRERGIMLYQGRRPTKD